VNSDIGDEFLLAPAGEVLCVARSKCLLPGLTAMMSDCKRASTRRLAALMLLSLFAPAVESAPPSKPGPRSRGVLDPLLYRDLALGSLYRLSRLEIVEMASALPNLPRMGAGDGWFHPRQSRYDWKWLAARFDTNRDGKITPKEFKGPAELFARLDRDRDGVITAEDFDWSERSSYVRQMGMVSQWMYRIDTSSNGRISKHEWDDFFQKAAKGKDHLTPEDLREALMQMPKRTGPPARFNPLILLAGLATGELGSFIEGPGIGEKAPNFTLSTHDGKQSISLSDHRGKKPVVLIFGSFT
jgi:hypothetical protein